MTRVLVTGGLGYIGSHVVLALQDAGYDVKILDFDAKVEHNHPKNTVACLNVSTPYLLDVLTTWHGVDYVVHCAAYTSAPDSIRYPQSYYANNVTGMSNMLAKLAGHATCRGIVFSSSAAVYGEPRTAAPICESDVTDPINPYGRTKLIGEWLLDQQSINSISLRYFNVAGADPLLRTGQRKPSNSLFQSVLVRVGTDVPMSLTTDAVRDFVHPSDVASAHVAAVRKLERLAASKAGSRHEVYNVGTGAGLPIADVLQEFADQGARVLITPTPPRKGDPLRVSADVTKIRSDLSWTFTQYSSLPAMVSTALAWHFRKEQKHATT